MVVAVPLALIGSRKPASGRADLAQNRKRSGGGPR
jgi:hypothetical protein